MDRATIKAKAKQQIKGKLGVLFLITLIFTLIVFAAVQVPHVGIIATFIFTAGFSLSLIQIYLGVTDGVKPAVGDLFKGFNHLFPAIKLYLLMGVKIFLWSLLFFIPGLVKSYAYSMAPYILAENPGMSASEAIRRSKEMTNGHKMDLFVLGLSFFGWCMLVPFTFGLLGIWLVPYAATTFAFAYKSLKGTPAVESSAASGEDIDFAGFGSEFGSGFGSDFGSDFGGESGSSAGSSNSAGSASAVAPAAAPASSGSSSGGDDMFSAADMDEINKLSEIL